MSKQSQHKYDYEIDLNGDSTGARIVRLIGDNKRVLELGAGPGAITKHLKNVRKCDIVAIENDSDAIEELSAYCAKIYNIDLNRADWQMELANEEKFDVVLAADVLEHLYDPWKVLSAMRSLLKDDGCIIVSLPHIGHNAVLASILDKDFEYRDWGLLDKTHIRFFAMRNIQSLFESAKLRIDEAQFVLIHPELTELANHWRKLSGSLKNALLSNKYGIVYQVIIKTVPENNASKGVDLLSITIDTPRMTRVDKLKSFVNSYLPDPMRAVLRRFVHRLRK